MRLRQKLALAMAIIVVASTATAFYAGETLLSLGLLVLGAIGIWYLWQKLSPLEYITQMVEALAAGDLNQSRLTSTSKDEFARLSTALNQLMTQLRGFTEEANGLASGHIGVRQLQERILKTGRLSEVDLPMGQHEGDLNRSFAALTNQLRRLATQARIIANDRLYNAALDERLPGELGESFTLMFENLRTLSTRAHDIANGDLTTFVDGEGDLNGAFNSMITGLRDLVHQIMESAYHVSASADQILIVLREQEAAAYEQSSRVRQTQRTMQNLLASANRIAESAETVFRVAEQTHHNHHKITRHIGELKAHTDRIDEILKLIQSIADRSDLLALNASLEGGRAGEAGKGFALVAREMRHLAENIKDAVGDIKNLVRDIRNSSVSSVMAADEGKRLSESTTESALDIKVVTQQQRKDTEEVTLSMEELADYIHHGVAGMREVTVAASDLATLSEDLRSLVERFRISEGSSGDTSVYATQEVMPTLVATSAEFDRSTNSVVSENP